MQQSLPAIDDRAAARRVGHGSKRDQGGDEMHFRDRGAVTRGRSRDAFRDLAPGARRPDPGLGGASLSHRARAVAFAVDRVRRRSPLRLDVCRRVRHSGRDAEMTSVSAPDRRSLEQLERGEETMRRLARRMDLVGVPTTARSCSRYATAAAASTARRRAATRARRDRRPSARMWSTCSFMVFESGTTASAAR